MDLFAALADPTRRDIVEMLAARGRLSAGDIGERFRVTPSAISQHLKVLREAGLVRMEKQAQRRIYEVDTEAMMKLAEWARQVSQRFDRLEALLQREKRKARIGGDQTGGPT